MDWWYAGVYPFLDIESGTDGRKWVRFVNLSTLVIENYAQTKENGLRVCYSLPFKNIEEREENGLWFVYLPTIVIENDAQTKENGLILY